MDFLWSTRDAKCGVYTGPVALSNLVRYTAVDQSRVVWGWGGGGGGGTRGGGVEGRGGRGWCIKDGYIGE